MVGDSVSDQFPEVWVLLRDAHGEPSNQGFTASRAWAAGAALGLCFGCDMTSCPQASVSTVQLWASGILAILRVLISQSTEDIVLARIQELSFSPYLISCPVIARLRNGDGDAAAEGHSEEKQMKNLPEEIFSRYALCLSCKDPCLGRSHAVI